MGGAAAAGPATVAGATKFFAKANIRPLLFCAMAVFGAITYGYDGTYFTAILEMDKFKQDFGQLEMVDGRQEYVFPSNIKSAVTSIVQAGELIGALIAGPMGDWVGRRGVFFGAAFMLTLGAVLQLIVAGSVPLLGLGRGILGMGVGMLANCTPLYLSEISTVAIRGVVVSSWQLMLAIGQVVGACVGQGTHLRTDTGAYRIPIGLNLLLALILVCGQLIIPESPRWLVAKGRDDQAAKALYRLNKDQEDPDRVVEVQLRSFQDAQREDMEAGQHAGWKNLFTSPIERRKLLIVCGVLASQQINGIQFVFSYTTSFFAATGINDSFIVTIIVNIVQVIGVLASFLIVNRFGRRPLLFYTSIPMVAALFLMAALGTIERNDAENKVIIFCVCLFVFSFDLAWGPLAWVVASETATGPNRQKLMSLGSAMFFIWAFIVAFTLPYLHDDTEAGLGTQVGWIYGGGAIIGMLFTFFCVPETRGRTLEEIHEMLNERVPTRKWTEHTTSLDREHMGDVSSDAIKPSSAAAVAGGSTSSHEDADVEAGASKQAADKDVGLHSGTQDA